MVSVVVGQLIAVGLEQAMETQATVMSTAKCLKAADFYSFNLKLKIGSMKQMDASDTPHVRRFGKHAVEM